MLYLKTVKIATKRCKNIFKYIFNCYEHAKPTNPSRFIQVHAYIL